MHHQNDLVMRLYQNGVTTKDIGWNLKIHQPVVSKILRDNGILLGRGGNNRKYQVNDNFEFSDNLSFLRRGTLRIKDVGVGDYWKITSPDPTKLEKIKKKLGSTHPIKQSGYNSYMLQICGKSFANRVRQYREQGLHVKTPK